MVLVLAKLKGAKIYSALLNENKNKSALMFVAKDLVVSSTSLGADCEDDYLQDPELWKDSLPQPYQLVEEILQEILFISWQLIEARRAEREAEESKPVIPRCSEATVLQFLSGVTDITPCACLEKKCSIMFVTSSTAGLAVIDMITCASGQVDPTVMTEEKMDGAQRVHARYWRDTKKHSLVAVTMATGMHNYQDFHYNYLRIQLPLTYRKAETLHTLQHAMDSNDRIL